MDKTLIFEISSDDDVGFDDSSTADNFDWISKLFNDTPLEDDVNLFSFGDNGGDDDDDVVVVGETIPNPKKAKVNKCVLNDDDGDDDDCVVLDCDPDKKDKVETNNGVDHGGGDGDDEDELVVVGEKGQVACRDYPHSRHMCAKFPFNSTPHESRCDLCHCYVCDSLAPCAYWGSGVSGVGDHCHANDKDEYWQLERKKVRQSKTGPMPITKPPAFTMLQLPQLPQNSARPHQTATRTPTTCGVSSSLIRPTIMTQGRTQRPSITTARTRFEPNLVSHQLVRTCNSSIQSNRGSTLASVRPVFKRCGYLNRGSSDHLRQAGSCRANSRVNTCQTNAISTDGLSSQLPAFIQPSHTLMSLPSFQGSGIPSAVTSDSIYVSTPVNQIQNVSIPTILQYSSDAPNYDTPSSQQPSAMLSNVTGLTSHGRPSNVPNYTAASIQQHNLSGPSLTCQPFKDGLPVETAIPPHDLSSPSEQNPPLSCDTSSSPLDLDIERWLSDNEPVNGTQDGSYFCDMNNQSAVTAPVDTAMLYFDFETSWKGLTYS